MIPTPARVSERGRFRARPTEVDALRIVLGVTTKADILALCPDANVGVPGHFDNHATTDLRWVVIFTSGGSVEAHDGDWIVSGPGGYEVLSDAQLRARFQPLPTRGAFGAST